MHFLNVLLLAMLPALGNFAGGVLAEIFPASERRLSVALHLAAGIIIAVIGVELMPRTLDAAAPWLVVLAFCLGGGSSILIKSLMHRLEARSGGETSARSWMIYIAVATDLFSDGLMIGAGSVVSFQLALLLALAQIVADVPEGYATIANLRNRKVARRTRLLLSASFAIPILVAATLSYWFLRDQSPAWQMSALAFSAGLLIVAAVEDMVAEAHEIAEDFPLATAAFIGGFALFTLISSYFSAD